MAFNAAAFLSTVYEEAFDTKRPLMPEGEWRGFIRGVDVAPGNREETVMFRISIIFDDENLKSLPEMEGRDQIIMNETLFVDVDPKNPTQIKFGGGQNWQLGQLRHAAGQNHPGRPWSPSMLEGQGPIIFKIAHREIKKDDGSGKKVGTGELRDNIVSYAAA